MEEKKSKKCIVIWSNGDREEFLVTDDFVNSFCLEREFDDWQIVTFSPVMEKWNMKHARKVWIE